MAVHLETVPKRDEVLSVKTGWIADRWLKWLTTLRDALNSAPQREIPTVRLVAQSGSLSAAALPAAPLKAGFYRVSVFARCTAGAGVTVALGFVLDGVAETITLGPADPLSACVLVQVDADSAITYAVTAPGMVYDAGLCLERVEV